LRGFIKSIALTGSVPAIAVGRCFPHLSGPTPYFPSAPIPNLAKRSALAMSLKSSSTALPVFLSSALIIFAASSTFFADAAFINTSSEGCANVLDPILTGTLVSFLSAAFISFANFA